jgi:acetylornithine deacetylase/succinyl-diaminopimelate desuccinylase-like protein
MLAELTTIPAIGAGWQFLEANLAQIVDEAVSICEIPAPPFQEARRAEYVAQRMEALALGPVRRDSEGNVICELSGSAEHPPVVLTAHLDTVFGHDTPIVVRREGHLLQGPGIGDNSMAVAALLWLGRGLKDLPGRSPLVLGANVGEEGLGNLRGIRALWDQFGDRAGAWVILEGGILNHPSQVGVCVRRLSIRYRTEGGHSWSHFGRPSAIHALGRLIDQIAQINVPREPKTTYNVGVIQGGRGVNTIAPEASLVLDLRSVEPDALAALERAARSLTAAVADASGVQFTIEVLSDRAGGRLRSGHRLAALVEEAAATVGVPIEWRASSTDANVPLSHGAAAVCLGLAKGENVHAEDEVLDVSLLPQGLRQAYLVLSALLLGRGKE